eukprot:jgi/Psemu1/299463/fgenesh1_pm.1541_\
MKAGYHNENERPSSVLRTGGRHSAASRVSFSEDRRTSPPPPPPAITAKSTTTEATTSTSTSTSTSMQPSSPSTKGSSPRRPSFLKRNKSNSSGGSSSPLFRRFRKGFSIFGGAGDRRNSGYGTLEETNYHHHQQQHHYHHHHHDETDAESPVTAEADPVMTIFESRNTQRVRFTLAGDGGESAMGGGGGNGGGVGGGFGSSASRDHPNNAARRGGGGGDPSNSNYSGGGYYHGSSSSGSGSGGAGNIKQFMSRALFGSKSSSKKLSEEEMKREVKELGGGSLIWESAATPTGPEVIHTKTNNNRGNNSRQRNQKTPELTVSFTEDPKARAAVSKLLAKASRAEHTHFRYEYAVKCYLKALNILQKQAKYPDDHPTVVKTVHLMNNAHNVLISYNNSANIVKMGIKNEDAGELVKALKMYTIAYRIRRDNLSRNHPHIQIKRGELHEAMQIYELALNDDTIGPSSSHQEQQLQLQLQQETASTTTTANADRNLLAKSVTFREMGTIYEMWGNVDEALEFFHKSLECVAAWRETVRSSSNNNNNNNNQTVGSQSSNHDATNSESASGGVSLSRSSTEPQHYCISNVQTVSSSVGDQQEMELVFGSSSGGGTLANGSSGCHSHIIKSVNQYERFFPNEAKQHAEDAEAAKDGGTRAQKGGGGSSSDENSHADMDLSLTLHQIARLYCSQGKFDRALDAYEVALRGMKTALGKHHPNVAAVLGNIGNLQKEMGDLDGAYNTYQEVLGIESYRLGLSHPDVAITLHNIATIDAARGNYEHSLQLYQKVIELQKKLFGVENISVAVTAACMGDVYEKVGDLKSSMNSFDEAVRIKSAVLGRHCLEVGRLLHKLGKLSFLSNDYLEAESYISRTILIYRLNKLDEHHEWFVDANRDSADIDGAIATGVTDHCEI